MGVCVRPVYGVLCLLLNRFGGGGGGGNDGGVIVLVEWLTIRFL